VSTNAAAEALGDGAGEAAPEGAGEGDADAVGSGAPLYRQKYALLPAAMRIDGLNVTAEKLTLDDERAVPGPAIVTHAEPL